ncbi:alpha/beta hydrolase fold-3 domain-containing protein [Xylariomycetidae sp. FL0641]|nr:alpha/beta hydrolase fold-3 domain-containing protein [Xylariomycetidae sp. FL0641]
MAYTEAALRGRPLVSYPPLRFLYKLLYLSTLLARLPLWVLSYALLRGRRLHPSWTLRQTVMVRLTKAMLHLSARAETPQKLRLRPGKEGARFATLAPFASDVYRGVLAEGDVAPATIGGTWFPAKPNEAQRVGPGTKTHVVLHLHGGAFVLGDGRTDAVALASSRLLAHAGAAAVFCPQYRLSSRPTAAPFPAALQDALTAYLYLVRTLGVAARSVTLSGDSAGGNLAIALLRWLAEHGDALGIPPPGSAAIVSGWAAPVKSLWPAICTTSNPHYGIDMLPAELLAWGARAYARVVPATDPYITPLGHPFATPVPLFFTFGTAEIFAVDGRRWVREMREVEGNVVEDNWEPGAPHDTLLLGDTLGWRENAKEVARQIGAFVRKHQ